MKISASVLTHLPITTFCWLPPESWPTISSIDGVLMRREAMFFSPLSRICLLYTSHDLVPGCQVVACADYFEEAAVKTAAMYDGIKAYQTGEELIAAPEVQAVVITSSDPSHAGYVLESLKYGKYVFCEKPLAQNAADCEKIIEAELAHGKRLVQVGFMRRYDRGYAEMKRIIDSGELGAQMCIRDRQ